MPVTGTQRRIRRRLALATVQENLCAYCFGPMDPPGPNDPDALTMDEVVPQCLGGTLVANTVAVHFRCNYAKLGRPPNGCELIAVQWVTARLMADPDLGYRNG